MDPLIEGGFQNSFPSAKSRAAFVGSPLCLGVVEVVDKSDCLLVLAVDDVTIVSVSIGTKNTQNPVLGKS
jgi:hypothetical protein